MARSTLTDANISAVKDEIRSILIETARARQTITYSELCLRLTTVTLHYHSFFFHKLLREVCGEEWQKGSGMLCALVVLKGTGLPSGGYFDQASGADPDDLEAEWRRDLDAVYERWSDRAAGL
jgi:hypothetical protein